MNYLNMVNEVLVRMREDEVTSVTDPDNDAQQKIVCKFVQDAYEFVKGAHTWNATRRYWVVPLLYGIPTYTLTGAGHAAGIYTVRYSSTSTLLAEANARYMSTRKPEYGSPSLYSTATTVKGDIAITVYPIPDDTHLDSLVSAQSEYGENVEVPSEYTEAEWNGLAIGGDSPSLVLFGYSGGGKLTEDDDDVAIPDTVVMYYALAYASRERGELGGQSSAELFALAASYLSGAISGDVDNSSLEYIWSAV